MIVVLLGTNPYSFSRLLLAVDRWAATAGEKVIAQVGHTATPALHLERHDFVDHGQIMSWLSEADVAICHGGFGSLRDCLAAGKPTIAVPRLREEGECQDVQTEVVNALSALGKVVALSDVSDLGEKIREVRKMSVVPGEASSIPRIVAEKVRSVLGEK
jgi:UDP-N-acetylglucosamine transferase subunit ALG13